MDECILNQANFGDILIISRTKYGKWIEEKVSYNCSTKFCYCFNLCSNDKQLKLYREDYGITWYIKDAPKLERKNILEDDLISECITQIHLCKLDEPLVVIDRFTKQSSIRYYDEKKLRAVQSEYGDYIYDLAFKNKLF